MKILIASVRDQAGSGQRFVDALRAGGVDATMLAQMSHPNGYHIDQILSGNKAHRMETVRKLLKGVDVLHFKGDHLPGTGTLKVFNMDQSIPRVITAGGSGFRRKDSELPSSVTLSWYPVDMYRKRVRAISVITPDMMYKPDIMLVPHAYPQMSYSWKGNKEPVIGHSPSHREKKGTDSIFIPAIQELRKRGHKFKVKIIEGVSHAECVAEKASCDLFFDQAMTSAYGVSAVEAMMMGVPVVTRMKKEVIGKDPMYECSPIGFFENPNPIEAANALEGVLLSNMKEVSQSTWDWAMRMHSYEAVFPRLMALYGKALTKESPTRPPHQ